MFPGLKEHMYPVLALFFKNYEERHGNKSREITKSPKHKTKTYRGRRSDVDTIQEYGRVIKRNGELAKWQNLPNPWKRLEQKISTEIDDLDNHLDLPGSWRIM